MAEFWEADDYEPFLEAAGEILDTGSCPYTDKYKRG